MSGHSLLNPLSRTEVASAAVTATANSSTITLPISATYTWILDVTAIAGTNPTLDVELQVSPQSPGTPVNWYGLAGFRQFTTTIGVDVIKLTRGKRDTAGAEWLAFTSGSSSGPISVNFPLTRKVRFAYTIGGTAGQSFTFAIFGIYEPQGAGG